MDAKGDAPPAVGKKCPRSVPVHCSYHQNHEALCTPGGAVLKPLIPGVRRQDHAMDGWGGSGGTGETCGQQKPLVTSQSLSL